MTDDEKQVHDSWLIYGKHYCSRECAPSNPMPFAFSNAENCAGCGRPFYVPVAPAPTASEEFEDWDDAAQEWLGEHFHSTADGGVWRRKVDGKCFMVTELMEMYASSQSSKLEGVGQEAADRLWCSDLTDESPKEQWIAGVAAIIDELIAGRMKP